MRDIEASIRNKPRWISDVFKSYSLLRTAALATRAFSKTPFINQGVRYFVAPRHSICGARTGEQGIGSSRAL
jgi:hypothetical protein